MSLKVFTLASLPPAPTGRRPQVRRACRYLVATHQSVNGLFESFNLVREEAAKGRETSTGRLSRDQVDLLRATLVFTSSGLDATCQTLVRECVPVLIGKGGTARMKFEAFIDQEIQNPSKLLIAALKDSDPRASMIGLYVDTRTKASYQGTTDLKDRVRDVLGIPNTALAASKIDALAGFFRARNDIVHRLDHVDPKENSTKRHHRAPAEVVAECDRVLHLVSEVIAATATLLVA